MPARNIHLTKELDAYVTESIEAGRYANASEVIRAGLLSLRSGEEIHQAKVEALRTAVLHGINSGVAEGDVMGRIRDRIRERAAQNLRKRELAAS